MENRIILLRNNDNRNDTDLEKIKEFYNFLIGEAIPDGIHLEHKSKPNLSKRKAFAIIWYLQEHLSIFPDNIEKCDFCGELYDTFIEGGHWELKGKNYCGYCSDGVPNES